MANNNEMYIFLLQVNHIESVLEYFLPSNLTLRHFHRQFFSLYVLQLIYLRNIYTNMYLYFSHMYTHRLNLYASLNEGKTIRYKIYYE